MQMLVDDGKAFADEEETNWMKFCVHISLHRLHVENPLKLHSLFDNNVHHQRPRLQRSSTRLDLSSMPETEVLLSLVSKALHPRSALKLQLCNFVQPGVFKLQLCASVRLCAIMQKSTNDPPAPGYCSPVQLSTEQE